MGPNLGRFSKVATVLMLLILVQSTASAHPPGGWDKKSFVGYANRTTADAYCTPPTVGWLSNIGPGVACFAALGPTLDAIVEDTAGLATFDLSVVVKDWEGTSSDEKVFHCRNRVTMAIPTWADYVEIYIHPPTVEDDLPGADPTLCSPSIGPGVEGQIVVLWG